MAKQTFTTGQVLTAAQVNSLQANDFNQTVSVKTANYTLVAADKGTRIEFNTSGSVTCTVNTGIFDAGDTLIVQNRGAGVVTITAGTATVNTSATLSLSQYDAGTLYFISASAAIFFNTDAGGGSPLTTKGDLFTYTTTDARLASSGVNNDVLMVDTSTASGLKWAAPASGDLVKLASGTISGTAISFNNVFSSTYTNYWFFWTCTDSDGDTKMRYRVSNADDSTTGYRYVNMSVAFGGTPAWGLLSNGTSQDHLLNLPYVSNRPYKFGISFTGTVDGSLLELINYEGFFNGADAHSGVCFGRRSDGTAYDGFSVFTNGSTMSGTYGLYAYKR